MDLCKIDNRRMHSLHTTLKMINLLRRSHFSSAMLASLLLPAVMCVRWQTSYSTCFGVANGGDKVVCYRHIFYVSTLQI